MNYFDCHADTLTEIISGETLDQNSGDLDLNRLGDFVENYTQIFAVWKDAQNLNKEDPDRDFLQLYHRAIAYLEEENRKILLCKSGEDMKKAHSMRKAAAFLSIEDISLMGKYVENVREMGFRFAMLTWNYENKYGCGAAFDQEKGLTSEGKELVKTLLSQNLVMDVSHLSDQGVEALFGLTDRPIIASHSNVRERTFEGTDSQKGNHWNEFLFQFCGRRAQGGGPASPYGSGSGNGRRGLPCHWQ